MTPKNIVTLILGTTLTMAPQFIAAIPQPYATCATAAIALLAAIYHLFQPSPNGSKL